MAITKKNLGILILILVLASLSFSACGKKVSNDEKTKTENTESTEKDASESGFKTSDELNLKGGNVVKIEMEDGGIIKAELYPEIAPKSVANFEKLVKKGFYDGLIFHRVIDGFMIQGGDPEGTGMGGTDETIKGEFSSNGVDNPLSHTLGVLSMARSDDSDSASSQFFICVADVPHLDGQYAAFGKVIEGLDIAEKIAKVEKDGNDKPLKDIKMKKVTIE